MQIKLKVNCITPIRSISKLKLKSKNKTFGIPKVAISKSKSNIGSILQHTISTRCIQKFKFEKGSRDRNKK